MNVKTQTKSLLHRCFIFHASAGNAEAVRELLEWGADANGGDGEALRYAACRGDVYMTLLLLHWGIDVNARNSRGWTALMLAALNGRSEIVHLLLEAGADVNVKDEDEHIALDFALWAGDAESFLVLFEKTPRIKAKSYEKTALIWATKRGFAKLVAGLLDCGVGVDTRDWKGKTALIWAAYEGHKSIFLQLLES